MEKGCMNAPLDFINNYYTFPKIKKIKKWNLFLLNLIDQGKTSHLTR